MDSRKSPPEINGKRDLLEYVVLNLDRGSTIATRVRVAGTSAARRRGLLGVAGLLDESGIWIAPCEAIHTFGMRMPLDVLFLDPKLRVRKLSSHLAPSRIRICLAASSVLEVAQGAISRSRTEVGDRLSFSSAQDSNKEQ